MKRFTRITLLALCALLAGACSRHKIIPDEELALIFHDAFLANAYTGSRNMKLDSLNLYEPIFADYGYTTADVQYTIGNFSKRKSARLGDVVERAIVLLEDEGKFFNREVAALDTIDNVARRTFTRRIFEDTLVQVRKLRDTARLRIALDVEPGEYNLRLKYLVDSLDRNERGLKGSVWLETHDSVRVNHYSTTLRRNREEGFSRRLVADSTHRRLRIDLLVFGDKPRQPSVTVRDFTVDHTPPTRVAVDSLFARQLNLRIFADEFFRPALEKDSL